MRSENAKRTSSGVVCENEEVPGFHQRITELTNQKEGQLQHLKISRYEVCAHIGLELNIGVRMQLISPVIVRLIVRLSD